jgi:hypothetical protein
MDIQFNPANPQAIEYKTPELGFTVLGGIRLDGLDRLRVTLKVEVVNRKFEHYLNNADLANLALRHNLDLYNDTQVEKLIRKAAERLEVGSSALAKAVSELTGQLEQYRLQQIEEQNKHKQKVSKPLTQQEKEEATTFLQQANLLQVTAQMLKQSGIVGEEQNSLLMYLVFTTRKREQPLHVISFGSSGTGKTYLQEKVSELIPDEDKMEITTLSDNAFYYFEKNELSNKLILIEDFDGALGVLYPLRELQSKKRITKTVTFKDSRGQTKSVHLTVEGPVCVAGCTTKESMYEDNANRSFLLYLDESKEQDDRIMTYQRALSAGKIDHHTQNTIKTLLRNTQRVLQPIKVINPYAELLQLPIEVFKPRRTNAHYLHFIEAITFYKQCQREQRVDESTGEMYIETTIEDIEDANRLMKDILLRKSDELTGACRNYFEKLKQVTQQYQQTIFTNKEVRNWLRVPISTVKRHNLELLNIGYLKLHENKKEKGYKYEIITYEEYQQLQNKIVNVLDEVLNNLTAVAGTNRPSSPKPAQLQNEPPKPKRKSPLKPQPKSSQESITPLQNETEL